jgi:hypothetical protein
MFFSMSNQGGSNEENAAKIKILVFLHGTTIMHRKGIGHSRAERVKQVHERDESLRDFAAYVPVDNAVKKLQTWKRQGAEIVYLSSHRTAADVEKDRYVLEKHDFPSGRVLFRQTGEEYKDVAERIMPDIIIEDDCESIGGEKEMVYPHITPVLKTKMVSIVVKEFGGIDHLPDKISALRKY